MAKAKKLHKRQLAVIDDLFKSELVEQEVLDKHRVSRNLYNKWLADAAFAGQLDRRIADAYRQSAVLLARHAPSAARKLVGLTDSEKQETARRACLDIIQSDQELRARQPKDQTQSQEPETKILSEQTAGKLLAVLAEEAGVDGS